jgi:hypothetical protein
MVNPLTATFTAHDNLWGFDVTYENVSESVVDLWYISTLHGIHVCDANGNVVRSGNEFAPRHFGPYRLGPKAKECFRHDLAGRYDETKGVHTVTVLVTVSIDGGEQKVVKHTGQVALDLPKPPDKRPKDR